MRRSTKSWLTALLLLSIPLLINPAIGTAQTVTLPKEISAIRGEWVPVTPKYDGDFLRWRVDDNLTEVDTAALFGIPPEQVKGKVFKYSGAQSNIKLKIECWTAKVVNGKAVPSDIAITWIVVGSPEPIPVDPKPVDPKPVDPKPAPIPDAGFRVLLIYESNDLDKMPVSQTLVLSGQSIRQYLNSKCIMGPDGRTRDWRIWDKDVDLSGEAKLWQTAMARERKLKVRKAADGKYEVCNAVDRVIWKGFDTEEKANAGAAKILPWIIISTGSKGYEGPLPKTIDETLALLREFGE